MSWALIFGGVLFTLGCATASFLITIKLQKK